MLLAQALTHPPFSTARDPSPFHAGRPAHRRISERLTAAARLFISRDGKPANAIPTLCKSKAGGR